MAEYEAKFHLHDDDLPPEALTDPMKPPEQPILVHCIHCGEEYDSWRMIWVPDDEAGLTDRMRGFWCCPMEGCDGKGFTFDIWPVDPDYVDPETGEKYSFEDEPLIEGHDVDCECAECEMLRDEEEAQFERDAAEYKRKVESGEIKPPTRLSEDEDIPF